MDFEKRIIAIYQKCRTPEQIGFEFNQLQLDLEGDIGQAKSQAHEQLLNNFDQEVIERVRIDCAGALDRFHALLWRTTRYYLEPYAEFAESGYSFVLRQNPFPTETIHAGPYQMRKRKEDEPEPDEPSNRYRIGHPLAQRILSKCCQLETPVSELPVRPERERQEDCSARRTRWKVRLAAMHSSLRGWVGRGGHVSLRWAAGR